MGCSDARGKAACKGISWAYMVPMERAGLANPGLDRTGEGVDLTLEWIEAIGDNGRVAGYGININRSMGWARWLDRMMEIGGRFLAWHVHIYADNVGVAQNV